MLFLLAVIGAAVVAFVLYPIFARPGRQAALPTQAALELARLADQKEQILEAIRDLDFEHAAGKLSESDYQRVRADFVARAAEILSREEKVGRVEPQAPAASAPAASERTKPVPQTPAPAPEASAPEAFRPHCIACGQQNPEGAKFCFRCGAKIETLPAAKSEVAARAD